MSARAFIAFLRCEATQAEERANALRTVAANIESHASAEDATRKASKRKQGRDPNRPKRQHTAYTMYVTANYECIKDSNPDVPAREMISMVARQWAQVSEEEKEHWKQRAILSAAAGQGAEVSDEVVEYVDDDEDMHGDDENRKKRGASPGKKAKVTATV